MTFTGEANVPSPFPKRMPTAPFVDGLMPSRSSAMSRMPSPLRSPSAMLAGWSG